MANQIILKRSSTPSKIPTTAQLELGEIAINTYDGRIFIKKDNGTPAVVEIGGVTSVNSQIGAVVIDTDDVSEGSTNQYFTTARARASVSAGTGISYNSSTGVISTSQNVSTAGSPTFAGLTLTGGISSIAGSIIPSADITYDLGSPDKQWRDIYVGPGSLYVNGQKVLEDNSGTITFTADADQNIRITTVGAGVLQLGSSTTNINVDGTLQIASGKNITDSAGVEVNFGDNIDMNNNKIVGLGAPSANTDAATKKYVDDSVNAISTSSITQGNSNVTVTDTGTGTVTVTVDGSTALTVTSSGVVIAGNMTVEGTTTTVNSNTVSIADNIVTLNSDATGTPTQNAGVEVERGDEANVQLRWNEGSDKWTFTNDGAVYHPMAVNTDDLTEGSTNQYFTTTRARSSVSASTSTGVAYNSTTGLISLGSIPNSSLANNSITINGTAVALGGTRTFDTDAVSEGSSNLYFTNTRARGAVSATAGTGLSYNSSTGAFSLASIPNSSLANSTITIGGRTLTLGDNTWLSTYEIVEDSNLYFTDARARAALSAGSGISYNNTTGVISADTSVMATKSYVDSAVAGKDNTDEITEGTTNKYFTDARARGALSFTAGSGAYNSTTGVITIPTNTNQLTNGANFATTSYVDSAVAGKDNTDEITEGTTNKYFTDARARAAISVSGSLSYNSSTGVISYTTPSTSGISEGTNLYYTDARARAAVSFTAGSGAYNSSTGVFTIPTNTNQLTNGAGFVTSSGVTSIATSNGISGGTITSTGTLSLSGTYTGTWAVTGAITATGEVTAYYSDANLKKDIVEITNPIEKVMSLRGVTFRPNETALALGITDKEEVGVIAQEVEAVLPQLVTPSAFAGYKTVKYDKLTALLLEAVKAQQLQIDALRAEIAKLGGSAKTEL